ncbi:DUF7344 domain-containing protein [Salinilacihabitans rarus]|uniref:DUF7344 domain-containing protein n=1 Tax=Salinilacihabitans rarus TaxID=2961596 RepID=UPI0020C83E5A|nr:hypothetical protein [Salinilacihabitans rarus]
MQRSVGHAERMDAACTLLAEPQRRFLLYLLAGRGESHANLDALVPQIAAWERGVPVAAVDEEARQLVYVSMVHNHLPRLADYGIVEYDLRSGDVVVAAGFSDVESLLDQFRQTEELEELRNLDLD